MRHYLACYDISDDRERDRVAQLLGGWGNRVQESVFEVVLRAEGDLERLHEALREVVSDPAAIRLYRLCESCRADSHTLCGAIPAALPAVLIL